MNRPASRVEMGSPYPVSQGSSRQSLAVRFCWSTTARSRLSQSSQVSCRQVRAVLHRIVTIGSVLSSRSASAVGFCWCVSFRASHAQHSLGSPVSERNAELRRSGQVRAVELRRSGNDMFRMAVSRYGSLVAAILDWSLLRCHVPSSQSCLGPFRWVSKCPVLAVMLRRGLCGFDEPGTGSLNL